MLSEEFEGQACLRHASLGRRLLIIQRRVVITPELIRVRHPAALLRQVPFPISTNLRPRLFRRFADWVLAS